MLQTPALGHRLHPAVDRGPRVVLVDAYDSFTYSLVQLLLVAGAVVDVVACDRTTVDAVLHARPTHLVLSPGPGRPSDAGVLPALARDGVADEIPLLGVCLGHQALCEVYGAAVVRAPRIMHGKCSAIVHDGTGLFEGLRSGFSATRYHSLTVVEDTLPPTLRAVARTEDGTLMAVAHTQRPAFGVQFHPESVLTEYGQTMMQHFLDRGLNTESPGGGGMT